VARGGLIVLLAVDAGNTHTVLGLFVGERLEADWRIATRKEITADELGVLISVLFERAGHNPAATEGVIVASVVPDLNEALRATARRYFGHEPLFVGPGLKTGMSILYDSPHDVGADRIVNAVAAKARLGAPVIVVDFGTATTFDVVGAGGEYLGGVIAPGPALSAEALFERAARLHRVGLRRPERVIGRNTEQSMEAGLYHGYVGLVRGLIERIREELGARAPVVATGGLVGVFQPDLDLVQEFDPGLTLEGLRLLWHKNRP
jgi:type III pantothenate kinase